MKSILVVILVLAVVNLSIAQDNGQYRPEKYGKDGKYRAVTDGQYYDRYRNLHGNNQYYRYNPYNSFFNNQYNPYQRLNPYVYRNSIIQDSLIAPQVSVTSRPPAATTTTTAHPVVYATPTTIVPIYRDQYRNDHYARIVAQDNDANDNSYHYKYLTENGISAEENGVVDTVNGGGTRVSGFYEYVGDDGVTYRVDYTADENGFHPTGAHLP